MSTRFEKPKDKMFTATEFFDAATPESAEEDGYDVVVLVPGRKGQPQLRPVKQVTWDANLRQMIIEI